MRHSSVLIHKDKEGIGRKKRIERLSIKKKDNIIKETYISGIYPSILNCEYINDRIIFNWTIYKI